MKLNSNTGLPHKIGLYDPAREKDSCGVGFIVSIDGITSRKILLDAKTMLIRMSHRGAIVGSTGDGAGVMTSIPHVLFKNEFKWVIFI
jgi:glutamate synthase (NADPH/NADH)